MPYDAITIDTNIFRHNGWYLEGGRLQQLSQFKEGSVRFVLSEIVVEEIHKYLKSEAKDAHDAIKAARDKSRKSGLITAEASEQLSDLSETAISADDAAKKRLWAFRDITGMAVIPAKHADIEELVRRYFRPSAPFRTSGKKKNEFPDAIALLSMEKWAESEDMNILAVSEDDDWADFAKESMWIDVEKDFAKALQTLQKQPEEAKAIVTALLSDMDKGNRPDLLKQIADAMANTISGMDVYSEASSAYHFDDDGVTLSLQVFQFEEFDDGYDLTVVQTGRNKIVAQIGVSIQATAECEFSLAIWDSIDKEYVPMGGSSAETDVHFDATALVTFNGDFSASTPKVELSDLELVEAIERVDFGELDIDYGDDHYYDDGE